MPFLGHAFSYPRFRNDFMKIQSDARLNRNVSFRVEDAFSDLRMPSRRFYECLHFGVENASHAFENAFGRIENASHVLRMLFEELKMLPTLLRILFEKLKMLLTF